MNSKATLSIQPKRLAAAIAGIAGAFLGMNIASAQPTSPNLTYATVGGRVLQLDLYRAVNVPPGERTPCVIFIHGGGWSGGNRQSVPTWVLSLRNAGISVASISYRLTSQAGQWGGASVTFPSQIHDVKGAVRWLRANADQLDLDPLRFGSWGTSAGGHLSALLATSSGVSAIEGEVGGNTGNSSSVQAAVDYFGPTDLIFSSLDVTTPPGSTIDHDSPTAAHARLVGFDDPGQGMGVLRANLNNPAAPFPFYVRLAQQANSVTWVDATDPQIFIAHGTNDTVVPLAQSTRLSDALSGVGVSHIYTRVQGAGHGGFSETVHAAARAFLVARLRCLADTNRDGVVDFFDYLDFVSLFAVENWRADINHDGTVDFFDYLDFVAAFDAEC
jgi:acetyl esterase/lipase